MGGRGHQAFRAPLSGMAAGIGPSVPDLHSTLYYEAGFEKVITVTISSVVMIVGYSVEMYKAIYQ